MDTADQLRLLSQIGNTSVAVTIRLLEILTIPAAQTGNADQRLAIHRQANMILRGSQEALFDENDREDVRQRYQLLLHVLDEFNDENGLYEVPDGISLS